MVGKISNRNLYYLALGTIYRGKLGADGPTNIGAPWEVYAIDLPGGLKKGIPANPEQIKHYQVTSAKGDWVYLTELDSESDIAGKINKWVIDRGLFRHKGKSTSPSAIVTDDNIASLLSQK